MGITFDSSAFEKSMNSISTMIKANEPNIVYQGAKEIWKETVARAPRGKRKNLADSIIMSEIKESSDGSCYIEVGPSKKKGFYGVMVEHGTVQRKTESGASRGFVAPQPFAEPAFQASKGRALDAMAKETKRLIERA